MRTRIRNQTEELEQVQADWEEALEALLADWEPITATQVDELVDQVRDAIADSDYSALAALEVDTDDAEDVLVAAMEDLAATAAQQMADTAADQGVTVAAGVVETAALVAVAAPVAVMLGAGLAIAAGAEAVRIATPGRTADEVADGVQEHLESLTDAHLRMHLGGALSAAQNKGRFATLEIAPIAHYEASEHNDTNTCGPCHQEDGAEFDTLADALLVYGAGGYSGCLGRQRCRGTVVASWDEDAA